MRRSIVGQNRDGRQRRGKNPKGEKVTFQILDEKNY